MRAVCLHDGCVRLSILQLGWVADNNVWLTSIDFNGTCDTYVMAFHCLWTSKL
jgi:hypothetical protein